MHCAACEHRIQKAVAQVTGVTQVRASLKRATLTIEYNQEIEPDVEPVFTELGQHGYTFSKQANVQQDALVCESPTKPTTSLWKRLRRAILSFAALYLFWIIILKPLLSSVPSATASASLSALILFGVVASLSTCLATTGAFLLAYSAERTRSWKETALIQGGRLAAFTIGGALLGAIGGTLPASSLVYGVIGLIFGVGFLWVGLHLLELAPSLASRGIHLPTQLFNMGERIRTTQGWYGPILVGAVTFVLPCGFTQTAQTIALASGSATRGALIMLSFALGTLPVLSGISFIGYVKNKKRVWLTSLTGAALVVFGISQFDGALTVFGAPFTIVSAFHSLTQSNTNAPAIGLDTQQQVVKMTVAYGAFSPDQLVIKKGVPVRWEIQGVDISGCASSIVVPSYGIRKVLSRGLNVVTFTPRTAGIIPFSCSMGMIRGEFRVTN